MRLVVTENHPPLAVAGDGQTVECETQGGSLVAVNGTGSFDPDGDPLTFLWSAPGLVFDGPPSPAATAMSPLGTAVVTLTVSDAAAEATDTITVSVVDTAPTSLLLSVSPATLWPPNHRMVEVQAVVVATDVCSGAMVVLSGVSSNEPDDGEGDGDTVDDIQGVKAGTGDFDSALRAERGGGGPGRVHAAIYTSNSRARSSILRPDRTRSTVLRRNSVG